jgi:hypothetical protein
MLLSTPLRVLKCQIPNPTPLHASAAVAVLRVGAELPAIGKRLLPAMSILAASFGRGNMYVLFSNGL